MKKLLAIIVILALALGILCLPIYAQTDGPLATAEAANQAAKDAQWRANQASSQAQSARATANAAYSEATALAVEATHQADLLATAQAEQATATAAQATAQSQATRSALEVEATKSAIRMQETRAALEATRESADLQATAQAVRATAEADALLLERARRMQPVYTWGPWALIAAIGILTGTAVWGVWRGRARIEYPDTDVLLDWYTEPVRPLLSERVTMTPCLLRPITSGQSRRPVDLG